MQNTPAYKVAVLGANGVRNFVGVHYIKKDVAPSKFGVANTNWQEDVVEGVRLFVEVLDAEDGTRNSYFTKI